MISTRFKCSKLTIISLAGLALTLSALWSLHIKSQDLLPFSKTREWQQPSSISNNFPKLISTVYWQFDYEGVEKVLLKIKQTKNGELSLDQNAAKTLKQAASKLPHNMNEKELQRVELLITKGLPGKAGQQLAPLFTKFYHYQQASRIAHASIDTRQNIYNKEHAFKKTVLRQNLYLGEDTAKQLFGRQNALSHYLYARQHINANSKLNQVQKQKQLATLKKKFKRYVR